MQIAEARSKRTGPAARGPVRDPGLPRRVEAPTLALIGGTYALWLVALFAAPAWGTGWAIVLLAVAVTLHASLQHEVIHGHPTPWARVNAALVAPALSLLIPYGRFRDTHLAHHMDANLTDPYDDPESNYLDPKVWTRLPGLLRAVLRLNNTLAGRMILGPVLGQIAFMGSDWRTVRAGPAPQRRAILRAWAWHIPAVLPVLAIAVAAPLPIWAVLSGTYLGLSILKIRTFLEHQAHEKTRGRTVIIEDRGLLALLFLNNNFHVVHHMHPRVPWYRLPTLYRARAARFLACNEGYRYRSYGQVFARHFLRAKDPVPHPLMEPRTPPR